MRLAQKTSGGRLDNPRRTASWLLREGWHLLSLRKELRGNVVKTLAIARAMMRAKKKHGVLLLEGKMGSMLLAHPDNVK